MSSFICPDAYLVGRAALLPIGLPVHNEVPNPRPPRFYRVRQIGGYDPPVPDQFARTIQVEAWAPSFHRASRDAEEAVAALRGARGTVLAGARIYRTDLYTAPHELPDDLSGNPRFRFTLQLFLRAAPTNP
jgi:hypothetical protein